MKLRQDIGYETDPGFVYLLRGFGAVLGGFDIYKIGKTTNLYVRLQQIRRGLPFRVEILYGIRTSHMSREETYWHYKFRACLIKNEWFELTQNQRDEFYFASLESLDKFYEDAETFYTTEMQDEE